MTYPGIVAIKSDATENPITDTSKPALYRFFLAMTKRNGVTTILRLLIMQGFAEMSI